MNATHSREVSRTRPGMVAKVGLVALPLVVGWVASSLTSDAMEQFGRLDQPPLSPPAWLFPVAWTILYALMGIASALIYGADPINESQRRARVAALIVYGLQLALNFAWTIVFFGAEARWVAFGLLMGMWALIIALVVLAFRVDRTAGYLLLPYLAWTTFAAYLNLMIALLN